MDALAASTLGTLTVSALGPLEEKLLGRTPLFAPARLAGRLLQKASGGHRSSVAVKIAAGHLMRWLYGPALGLAWSLARRALPRSRTLRVGALTAGVAALELTALPATEATPPLRRWKKVEIALLLAQIAAFAAVTELAMAKE